MKTLILFVSHVLSATLSLAASGDKTADGMLSAEFLTTDLPATNLLKLRFSDAIETLRQSVQKATGKQPPQVNIAKYDHHFSSADYPHMESHECLVSVRLSEISVLDSLELLAVACGYTIDLSHGQITAFEVPYLERSTHAALHFPKGSGPAPNLRQIKLPKFKVQSLGLLDTLDVFRKVVAESSKEALQPVPVIEYVSRDPDQKAKSVSSNALVSLDVKDVDSLACFRYITELAGCSFVELGGGVLIVREIPVFYHPKHIKAFRLESFTKAMGSKPDVVSYEAIQDWLDKELGIVVFPFINVRSGTVLIEHLSPIDEARIFERLVVNPFASGSEKNELLSSPEPPRAAACICTGRCGTAHHTWPGCAWISSAAGSRADG